MPDVWHAVRALLVSAHQAPERVDDGLDVAVDGNAALAKRAGGRRVPEHRLGEQRPAARTGGARDRVADLGLDRGEGLVHLAVAAEVPGEDHRIDLARLEHGRVHALEVPEVLLAGTREIDGVGGDDRRRDRRQARRELGREHRQLEACLGDEVGGDDAGATAVADDRDPPALPDGAEQGTRARSRSAASASSPA